MGCLLVVVIRFSTTTKGGRFGVVLWAEKQPFSRPGCGVWVVPSGVYRPADDEASSSALTATYHGA